MAHHHFPVSPHFRPYRWAGAEFQVGLTSIGPQEWLLIDETYAAFMSAKRAHLQGDDDNSHYYRTLASSWPAQRELRDLVVQHLLAAYPQHFALADDMLTCAVDGLSWCLGDDSIEPLFQLTRFVQEDFMLLEEVGGRQTITAASNAYSSSGRLVSAVGRDVRWCHEPVPDLTTLHGPRIERILTTVHEGSLAARFNWQLTPIATLFFPPDPHTANNSALAAVSDALARNPMLAPELLYLRVERQTLRRLPQTRAVAFSIHTYSDPLSSLTEDVEALRSLLKLLTQYGDPRLHYSEMHSLKTPAIVWLETLLAN